MEAELKGMLTSYQVHTATKEFLDTNPGYYACPENYDLMCSTMVANNWAPTKAGFETAYTYLDSLNKLKRKPTPEKAEVLGSLQKRLDLILIKQGLQQRMDKFKKDNAVQSPKEVVKEVVKEASVVATETGRRIKDIE